MLGEELEERGSLNICQNEIFKGPSMKDIRPDGGEGGQPKADDPGRGCGGSAPKQDVHL